MNAMVETDSPTMLLTWLRLLGWRTTTRRDGEQVFGVATHVAADGSSIRVASSARTDGELALKIFRSALDALEQPRTLAQRLAA